MLTATNAVDLGSPTWSLCADAATKRAVQAAEDLSADLLHVANSGTAKVRARLLYCSAKSSLKAALPFIPSCRPSRLNSK